MDEIRCPFCHSKDLSKLPSEEEKPVSIAYKCQMCGRTFSKTNLEEQK